MWPRSLHRSAAIAFFTLCAFTSAAQQSPRAPAPNAPIYTLHGAGRIVLTDVTVKDRDGRLVHGLPQSAFRIFDNGRSQTIASFDENDHAPTAIPPQPPAAANTFSNTFLEHLPPVLNIGVLDTTSLSLPQQMYLAYEFNHFLKGLPASLPIALYARTGDGVVLVQNFTADRKLLLTAAAKVMPRFLAPGTDILRLNDLNLFHELAVSLAQLPGHKNVIWFNGGQYGTEFNPLTVQDPSMLRDAYDLLEKARISIYPVDARGLQVFPGPGEATQHMQMEEVADGTGGQALFNTNGLFQAADTILADDSSFYTLTFSPQDFHVDNSWHRIKVEVAGGKYHLSYRRGYFADGMNMTTPERESRTLLLTGAATQQISPNLRSLPIIFSASLLPADAPAPDPSTVFHPFTDVVTPKHGEKLYTLRYSIPPGVFNTRLVDGRQSASFEIAVLAFNRGGEKIGEKGENVKVKFPPSDAHLPLNLAQPIALRRGDLFLYIALWDRTTGRTGTLQFPYTVK
jgi:VWFA-related protein